MQENDIKELILSAVSNSDIEVTIEGSHVHLVVVSPEFEGLSAVKRQQKVYAALASTIASGAIHAVHMKTYTPAERP
jgi:acid stress-induced BolA-like protein IbaG/YrbA